MMSVALEVRGIGKSFRTGRRSAVHALDGIDLRADVGEFVVLVGPSGCGKSTLLNIIAGLEQQDEGTVSLDGEVATADGLIGRSAYMHQVDLLLPWRDVLSNATLGLEVAGVGRDAAIRSATELAERFGIADFLRSYPRSLSGGMKQRVALLRAVLPERRILLLDEPFKALDAITRAELQTWLSDVLDRSGRATVMVTHDVEEALVLGDRVLVLSRRPGRTVLEVDVGLPRPRPADVVTHREFVDLKWQILSALRSDTGADVARSDADEGSDANVG